MLLCTLKVADLLFLLSVVLTLTVTWVCVDLAICFVARASLPDPVPRRPRALFSSAPLSGPFLAGLRNDSRSWSLSCMRIRHWPTTCKVCHSTVYLHSVNTDVHFLQGRARTRRVGWWRTHGAKMRRMNKHPTSPREELRASRNVCGTSCRSRWT